MGDDEDDHAVDGFYEKLMNKKNFFTLRHNAR